MTDFSTSTNSPQLSKEVLLFQRTFESQNTLTLLFTPAFKIKAVTDAYLRETLTTRERLVGADMFEVFPDNPEVGEGFSTGKLRASLQQTLASKQPHQMEGVRYDIPVPNSTTFIESYWNVVNTPILDEQGEVLCILHEATNTTQVEKSKKDLRASDEREKIALAQIEQQRLRLERLFAQVPAAMAILEGPDLEFKEINHAYQQLFPGRKLLGLGLFEALSELKGQPIEDIARHVITTGETFEGKEILVPLARYEGQPLEDIYWNFIYQALYDAQGKISGMFIFALDVTPFVEARQQVEKSAEELKVLNQELEERVERRTQELKLAKLAAEREQKLLEDLFMQAPTAITILDGPDLVYQLINPIYQNIFQERELLGKPLLEALPELEGTDIPDLLKRVYNYGEVITAHEFKLMMARVQGAPLEEAYFTFTYQARYNTLGEIDGILVFAIEVTEQVKARQVIEEAANNLKLITDSLPVLIGYLDKDRVYRFANKAYESWFPIKAEDLLGRKVQQVVGEKAYNATKGYMDRALAGERLSFEATMPYREGFVKHIKTDYVPDVRDGKVLGFYTLVTDVTDQVEARLKMEASARQASSIADELAAANEDLRLANLDLANANQQLTYTNKDLDNFIYTASHDLKAPISNIEMLLKELQVELPSASLEGKEVREIIRMMQNSIERFKKTIGSLTEITKLQKDNEQTPRAVNLQDVVQEVQLDLQQVIASHGAVIEADLRDDVTVSFSEKNLRSVVYNLLSNAIKYRHPDRKPVVKVSCQPEQDYVVLVVQDNGLGLNPKQQKRLFTMFSRFHDHVEGSGVGLYMVKRILDNAEGKIVVESEVGAGATFKVYLKRVEQP